MKHHKLSATLLALGLALGAVVAAPGAAVAGVAACQYVAQDLPLPSGKTFATLVASSPDNTLIVGEAQDDGVIWRDGQVADVLRHPSGGDISRLYPRGVNNKSTVVGYMEPRGGTGKPVFAFRYSGGRYYKLYTPEGYASIAYAINDHNDIAGVIYPVSAPEQRMAVVWDPLMYKYTTLLSRTAAIGVSADRKVLGENGEVHDLTTGSSFFLQGQRPYVLDNERLFGFSFGSMPEWTLTGDLVRTYDQGRVPGGVNKHNTLFGAYGSSNSNAGLWSNGQWTPVQADKQPEFGPYAADITDDGVLLANYKTTTGYYRAARWFCGS